MKSFLQTTVTFCEVFTYCHFNVYSSIRFKNNQAELKKTVDPSPSSLHPLLTTPNTKTLKNVFETQSVF